jgi:predicted DNA-binding transcriptional regulator YafY
VRADRLVATLLLLQARGRMTAAEVAGELEVSERTARRDLDALAMAGIPVYACAGRGGGWELLGGARTDLSGLTAAEARTLFAVAGPAAAASPELKAALRKLVRALPAPFRPAAQAAADAVVVDPGGWGATRRQRPTPVHLDALQQATIDGEQVQLEYLGRNGTPGARTVHPLGLVAKHGAWYLMADTTRGLRTFRVDRVRAVERTGQPVARPAEFDLREAWQHVLDAVDELRAPARVRAAADADVVHALRWVFDSEITVGQPRADGRVEVVLAGPSVDMIARRVAGFGGRLHVLDPPEARLRLAALARELLAAYEEPGATLNRCLITPT